MQIASYGVPYGEGFVSKTVPNQVSTIISLIISGRIKHWQYSFKNGIKCLTSEMVDNATAMNISP